MNNELHKPTPLSGVSLRLRLLTFFLIIGLVPFVVTSVIFSTVLSANIERQAFSKLASVRNIKKQQLQDYFNRQKGNIYSLGKTVSLLMETGAINAEELEDFTMPKTEGESEDYFKSYMERHGYYDLFLISPDGLVFYTVAQESEYQSNILTGKYQSSILSLLVMKVLKTKNFAFVDFAPYAPSADEPSAFIGQPILDKQGKVQMIVALQLAIEEINDIMQSRHGLGETGESYLVGQDNLMRSDSFLDKAHTVQASFANPSSGSVKTEAAKKALSGTEGLEIISDYRDVLVLSAFTPVKIFDAEWALIVEMDQEEAFYSLTMLQRQLVILGMIISVIIFIFALFVVRTIGVEDMPENQNEELDNNSQLNPSNHPAEKGQSMDSEAWGELMTKLDTIAQGVQRLQK